MLEEPMVPFYHLAKGMKDEKGQVCGGGKTTIHGMGVPLPVDDGRVPRGSIHSIMSHVAVKEM